MSPKLSAMGDETAMTREALPAMSKGPIGVRDAQGVVRVRASERRITLLHGPYWRLPAGRWLLRIRCAASGNPKPEVACLAVEVTADDRFLCTARDFTPADCARGDLQVPFAVAAELSDPSLFARFDFRLWHLGRADLAIERVTIEPIDDESVQCPASIWRLLPRARPTLLARQEPDGSIVPRTSAGRGALTWLLRPRVRLPGGAFALSLQCDVAGVRDVSRPFVRIALTAGKTRLMQRELLASDFDAEGRCEVPFRVPFEYGIESGSDARIGLAFTQLGNGGFALRSADVTPAHVDAHPALPSAAAVIVSSAPKVLVVGNCQAEAVCRFFRRAVSMEKFEPAFHFVRLSPLHLEQARRELAACDVLFVQDIANWDDYSLREEVPARTQIIRFPCLRFASPWPYDSSNGPLDAVAIEKEGENRVFPHLDYRLARLRGEVPDAQARFAAYAALTADEASMVERLGRFETRRLESMDRTYECDFGSFILENFRTSRVFHATGHPGGALFARLMHWMARRAGHRWLWAPRWRFDAFRDLQVPVHPEVARILGMTWAGPRTLYGAQGLKTDWESYIRAYIRHYG